MIRRPEIDETMPRPLVLESLCFSAPVLVGQIAC
jgi:hypothetical protein